MADDVIGSPGEGVFGGSNKLEGDMRKYKYRREKEAKEKRKRQLRRKAMEERSGFGLGEDREKGPRLA